MSRHKPEGQKNPPPATKTGIDPLALATLAGVVGLLMITFSNMKEIDGIKESLDRKLERIEAKVALVAERGGQVQAPAPAQPQRRGPDPDRVYQIKTANRPTKGRASAPITIAEFSDFQ